MTLNKAIYGIGNISITENSVKFSVSTIPVGIENIFGIIII
jgi:hypothetical protein